MACDSYRIKPPPQRRDREFIPVIPRTWRQGQSYRHLNEGTGSLSRSYSEVIAAFRVLVTSTKGPGVYPGHERIRDAVVDGHHTSTKGPGVYPGHDVPAALGLDFFDTSTKGPGVYPGHIDACQTAAATTWHLNEGTGSLSRSSRLR